MDDVPYGVVFIHEYNTKYLVYIQLKIVTTLLLYYTFPLNIKNSLTFIYDTIPTSLAKPFMTQYEFPRNQTSNHPIYPNPDIPIIFTIFPDFMLQYSYGKSKNRYHHLGSRRIHSTRQNNLVVFWVSSYRFNLRRHRRTPPVVEFSRRDHP